MVKNAAGQIVPNTLVTFAVDSSLALLSPVSGNVLSDSQGIASVQLSANGLQASGAGQVAVTATVDGIDIAGSAVYQVGAANVTLSALGFSANNIPAYGTSTVSIAVNVNGSPTTTPVSVSFTSGCKTSGKATLPDTVQTVQGVATATYTDIGCAGTDTITASVLGKSASGAIVVAAPQAANLKFSSASPQLIVTTGTGATGFAQSSIVSFQLVDTNGNPVASRNVTFDLSTRVGGVLLDGQASGTVTKQTGQDGTVSVSVQSGTVPTSLWVLASLPGGSLATQSNRLIISTGRPTQNFFSMSVGTLNIEGWDYDNVTSSVLIIASDRLANPVPDGTAINFVAEGGQIGSGANGVCYTSGGSCSVNFTSAAQRPADGRVTVLAYSTGEESFTDTNGNNVYDFGEAYTDLGDIFIDSNENGVWDAGEQYFPFGGGSLSCTAGNISKPNTCSGSWGTAHVRQNRVIVLSTSQVGTLAPSAFAMGGACSQTFLFRLADGHNNPMPAGTSISVTSNNVTYTTGGSSAAASVVVNEGTVLNTNALGGTYHSFVVSGTNCQTPPSGSFTLTITTPKGVPNIESVSIN
ncbi:MAG: hypothetical protein HGA47_01265 [Zoogloea sp.]|nr:hypothetical protein [Zoogloea sp.]